MLYRALPFLVVVLLASAASGQPASSSTEDGHASGPVVGYGLLSTEALALDAGNTWNAGYRWSGGSSIGLVYSADSYRSFSPEYDVEGSPEVYGYDENRKSRMIGAIGRHVSRLGPIDLGLSATVAYAYDRFQATAYSIQSGYPSESGEVIDSIRVLRPDFSTRSEHVDQRMLIATSVTASHDLRVFSRGRIAPGVGIAIGARPALNGIAGAEIGRAAAFVRLPISLDVTDTVRLTLDGHVGIGRTLKSTDSIRYTGHRGEWYPATGATLRLEL